MVKWTKKVLWYTKTIIFLVKGLKVVAKYRLNWIYFSIVTFTAVLNTQIENIRSRSLKRIIKSDAKKWMAKYGFGCRFNDLKYYEVGFFSYSLNSVST